LNGLPDHIDQLYHRVQKLCSHAAAHGPGVHFKLEVVDRALFLMAEALPPGRERIDKEVAGLGCAFNHNVRWSFANVSVEVGDLISTISSMQCHSSAWKSGNGTDTRCCGFVQ
jgi:hypothetical protein